MKTLLLDAGHGGKDPGAVNGIFEKDVSMRIVREIAVAMMSHPVSVLLTRKGDEFITLLRRLAEIKRLRPLLSLSIHCNAHADKTANGFETFRRFDHSIKIQDIIHEEMAPALRAYRIRDRGKKRADFIVLNSIHPSILVEVCFISNDKERDLLNTDRFIKEVSGGIVNSVLKYFNIGSGGGDRPLDAM